MSIEEIKHGIAALSPSERNELSAFLVHLRRASDPDYQERVNSRLAECDPENWVTPEEIERRLDQK